MLRTAVIFVVAAFSLLCIASCSSRAVGPGAAYRDYGYYDDYPYYSYGSYTSSFNYLQPARPAEQVTGLTTTKEVPGTYEDIKRVTETCAKVLDPLEYDIAYGRVPLGPRLTNVAAEYFSLASTSVRFNPEDDEPNVRLISGTYTPSIAVYHFTEVAAGSTISSISIDNQSQFFGDRKHGFFLGYRHDEGQEYKWYGPYTAESSWLLPLTPQLTYEPTRPSLVVVTTRGDILDLRSITVSVEEYNQAQSAWQTARDEYQHRLLDLERERYRLELDRLWLQEEWLRLEYEYYLLRQRERDDKRDRDHFDDGHDHFDGHGDGGGKDDRPDPHWGPTDGDRGRLIEVTESGTVVPVRHDLKSRRS